MKYCIWWTDQLQAECVSLPDDCPEYIVKEFDSRYGRPGRGRLWISSALNLTGFAVDPWPDMPLSRYLEKDSAGIVIEAEDAEFLAEQPGLITDEKLHPWRK